MKMSNDARIVFETIGKLAGLTTVFDADFPARRISVELTDVTIQQALDVVSLEAKAFWKPVTQNIVFVIADQPQKRRDYEEQVVQTYYLSNTVLPQDLTEIVTGLRQLLDLKRIQQLNSQNAIIVRDTPDKLALAEKMIGDIDKAKPEVMVHVSLAQPGRIARPDGDTNVHATEYDQYNDDFKRHYDHHAYEYFAAESAG